MQENKRIRLREWQSVKYKLESINELIIYSKAREIWWCALGENVGVEINGKSNLFSRPVLILKKLSREAAVIIPLTSKAKTGSWYVPLNLHGRNQVAIISQVRLISTKRLYQKIGTIEEHDFTRIKQAFLKLYCE